MVVAEWQQKVRYTEFMCGIVEKVESGVRRKWDQFNFES